MKLSGCYLLLIFKSKSQDAHLSETSHVSN